jgi:hypothetical protein
MDVSDALFGRTEFFWQQSKQCMSEFTSSAVSHHNDLSRNASESELGHGPF